MVDLEISEELEHRLEATEELIDTLYSILEGKNEEFRFETEDGHIVLFYSSMIDCRNCGDSVHSDDAYDYEFCDVQCYKIAYEEQAREVYEDSAYKAHKDRRRGVE